MNFKKIQDATHCIFSKGSKLEAFEDWDENKNIEENIEAVIAQLIRFTNNSEAEKLDGLVVEVKKSADTVKELAILTKQVIYHINKRDPQAYQLVHQEMAKSGWVFQFNGMKLHILTFASCYLENHPRKNYGLKSTYFLFQPHHSFMRRRDLKSGLIPEFQKEAIRKNFFDANMPYDIELSKSELTAYKFVKPQDIGENLVKWWEENEE